ncbi:MAG: polymorphic toxin-type HINT domain-containing protein, partial [Isosphaeraceae bacterium]
LVGSALLVANPPEAASPPSAETSAYQEAKARAGRDPDAHVKLALWCEAHGLQAERLIHLARAVLAEPSHAAARALMGMVAYQGRWEKPEAVADRVQSDAKLAAALAEYNDRRARAKNTADAQWDLALWCEAHDLKPEATAHLTAVTRLDPKREAAWKRLGYKRHDGHWMTDDQVAAEKADRKAQAKADAHWRPLLQTWKGMLSNSKTRAEAEAALAGVTDTRAVPSVGKVFARGDLVDQRVAVQLFGQIDSRPSSRALAHLAVYSPSAEVRRIASESLRHRDWRDFVGPLIGLLRDPIKYEVKQSVAGPGSPGVLFVEGDKANVQRLYTYPAPPVYPRGFNGAVPFDPFGQHWDGDPWTLTSTLRARSIPFRYDLPRMSGVSPVQARLNPLDDAIIRDQIIALNMQKAQRAAASSQQQLVNDVRTLDQQNIAIHEMNERILPVLQTTTEQDYGEDSKPWQNWWIDQLGMTTSASEYDTKPTLNQLASIPYPPGYLLPNMIGLHHSCFGAGTPVRTLTGAQAIETIQVGDRVLSQDPTTGAASYQPVLEFHKNPPYETLRIALGDETLTVTPLHYLWKAGKGWTMARNLAVGDLVRTLGGTVRVASITSTGVMPVFNLVVARNSDYFVGLQEILAHDDTMIQTVHAPFDAPPDLAAIAPSRD